MIDLRGIRRAIEAAGYTEPRAVEIFWAEDWWTRPGAEVLRTCRERFAAVIP